MSKEELEKYTELTAETKTDVDTPEQVEYVSLDDAEVPEKGYFRIKFFGIVCLGVFFVVVLLLIGMYFDTDKLQPVEDSSNKEPDMTLGTYYEEVPNETEILTEYIKTEPPIIEENTVGFYSSDRMTWEKNVIGEIKIPGTLIEDLVGQCDDNTYYIDYDINDNPSNSGALFLDYRNSRRSFDSNNVIYGHNMKSGEMFGTLPRLKASDFFSNNENVIYYNTIDYDNRFKIFSIYEIDLTTFNFIQTSFDDDSAFNKFLQTVITFNEVEAVEMECLNVTTDSKVLTLSTCTQGGTHRLVVHAYLSDSRPAQLGD